MRITINPNRAVTCQAAIELPLSATSTWGQLRDFHRYAQQDFFHADLCIEGGFPRHGTSLTMAHRFAGFHVRRVGRILFWREGVGFAFSDLSRRGPRAGFPHIFSLRLQPIDQHSCRLHIHVRGKWTAGRIPRWAAKLWLRWVFTHVVRQIENDLLAYALWRRSRHPQELP